MPVVTELPQPRRRWPLFAAAGAAFVVLVAAAWLGAVALARHDAANEHPAALNSPAAAASKTSPVAGSSDPSGAQACALLVQASGDKLMDRPTVAAIRDAARQSSDISIPFDGQMLYDRQELAIAAVGRSDEAEMRLGLEDAAIRMRTHCVQAGFTG